MTISYDPDKIPEIPPEIFEEAEALRMHVVLVNCDEPGAQVGDPGSVSFFAIVPFMPRRGDRVVLSDGATCEVERAYFRVAGTPDTDLRKGWHLVPSILAYKIQS